jgi:FeS assembly protein IscX
MEHAMAREHTFGWLEIDDIAEALAEAHPQTDPLVLRFTALRAMVEQLPGFRPDPDHPVNEKILEAIQAAWVDLRQGRTPDDEE